jgi:predicted esterase
LLVRLHGIRDFIWQGPNLYHRVMTIPGQVASALRWLIEQSWADAERHSLLGFSQGALAVPAVQDLAAPDGIRIGWIIIAYGGAPLGALLAANPHLKPT